MGALALLLPFASELLKKLFPDPAAQADAQFKLLQLAQTGELAAMQSANDLARAQIAVNLADATGCSPMQRNARPFILWVCGVALAWDTVLKPMLTYGAALAGHPLPALPNLQTEQLYTLMGGVLGLGGYRTIEKIKGAA